MAGSGWAHLGITAAVVVAFGAPHAPSVAHAADPPSSTVQVNARHTGELSDERIALPLRRRWTTILPPILSYPVIGSGHVFVTSSRTLDGTAGEALYALDQETGHLSWWRALGGEVRWANAAYEDGRVFAINDEGIGYAFDARTGATLWVRDLDSYHAPPVVVDGVIYGASGEYLFAARADTGEDIWRTWVGTIGKASPIVDGDRLYTVAYCDRAWALNRHTGAIIWHWNGGQCWGAQGKTAPLHQGRIYFGYGSPGGYLLDAASGDVLETYTRGRIPALKGDIGVFADGIPSWEQPIYAKNLETNEVLWRFEGDGQLVTPALIVNDIVFVGSYDGMFYALDIRSGEVLWTDDTGGAFHPFDEHNSNKPLTGLGAGDGLVVAPAGGRVIAYEHAMNPESDLDPDDGSGADDAASRPTGDGPVAAEDGPVTTEDGSGTTDEGAEAPPERDPAATETSRDEGITPAIPRRRLAMRVRTRVDVRRLLRRGLAVRVRGLSPGARYRVVLVKPPKRAGRIAARRGRAGPRGGARVRLRVRGGRRRHVRRRAPFLARVRVAYRREGAKPRVRHSRVRIVRP